MLPNICCSPKELTLEGSPYFSLDTKSKRTRESRTSYVRVAAMYYPLDENNRSSRLKCGAVAFSFNRMPCAYT